MDSAILKGNLEFHKEKLWGGGREGQQAMIGTPLTFRTSFILAT